MFRLTTKVKLAAGFAAGALTLGAAGAYAANANNNGSIPMSNLKDVSLGANAGTLTLKSTNGTTTSITIPATFDNLGKCVSLFAQHQDVVLQPAAGATKISKNSHGKLMSSSTIRTWCQARLTAKTKTDSTETETADATQSTDSTDSTTSQVNVHANGRHAHETD